MNHFTRVFVAVLLATVSLSSWAAGGLLSQRTTIQDYLGPYTNYQFGSTGVSLSSDGMFFLVASPTIASCQNCYDGTGAGEMFEFLNNKWSEVSGGQVSGPTTATGFGTGLALSADASEMLLGFGQSCPTTTIGPCNLVTASLRNTIIGSGFGTEFLDPTNAINGASNFGSALALSGNGQVVLVGAPGASASSTPNAGQVLIYTYAGTYSWPAPAVILNPDPATTMNFGTAVALSANGTLALVAARAISSNTVTVYVYTLSSGNWVKTQVISGITLSAVPPGMLALSAGGNAAIVSTDAGANIYSTSTGWSAYNTTALAVSGDSGDGSVAIAADGSSVLVGLSNGTNGLVYQFNFSGTSWEPGPSFDDPGAAPRTFTGFGQTGVALSADKETAVITAGYANVSSGQPYTFLDAGIVYVYQSPADLSITGTATPAQLALNQQTTLAFTVTNNDTQVTAYNVVFTDTLPSGLTNIAANVAPGSCSVSGQKVSCTLASLAPGATWSPSIAASVTTAGNYTDTASVSSNQPDPDTSNNSVNLSVSMLPPVATNGSLALNADTVGNGSLNGSNPCGCGTLNYSVVQQASHGTVTITNAATGAFSYTPTAGYLGSDSFTFQLANGFGTSAAATESITVKDVAPTANAGSISTIVNQAVSGTLSATPGYAEQKLSYAVTQPAHGAVTVTAATGAFTYTPDAGFVGTDSFTFTAGDGTLTSGSATITVTVKDIAPTADNGSATTTANHAVSGTLSATPGYAGQTMSFVAVTPPSHGNVSVTSGGAFTYTPNLGFVGTDSFTFTAGDGIVSSAAATVSITVQDIAPTSNNGSVITSAGQPVSGTLSATPGYTGQLLSYAIVANPAHGAVVLNASSGAFTYTPSAGYVGSDSFTFTAGDGIVMSATATVSITVAGVSLTANNGTVSTGVVTPVNGTLSVAPGYSGGAISFAIVSPPAHGVLALTNAATGSFTYTPVAGFVGSDSFTFTASGAGVTSNVATETIVVSGNGGGAFGLVGLGLLGGLLGFARRRKR